MGIKKRTIGFLCAAAFALLLCGCSAAAEKKTQPTETDATAITIMAAFKREDGTALADGAVRFSDQENSADYALSEEGELVLSGLPREGELTVTVFDQQTQPQGTVTLSFSQGSVIDVVTDEDGTAHITLKADTEDLALDFTLYDNGSLQCMLQLSESRIV